ncbi:uncharacterized protein B0T23DRAFT_84566 [Neurospora hispaniola]|uniref:Uncharacterized protein n=1 Tax=Neurospora hispaniola TaxID=588809 RepID=A0AAJ0IDD9_9PEZI|nr:hypothetical protein B0T23DRAFT_84566 [Neurospora hispaniola]
MSWRNGGGTGTVEGGGDIALVLFGPGAMETAGARGGRAAFMVGEVEEWMERGMLGLRWRPRLRLDLALGGYLTLYALFGRVLWAGGSLAWAGDHDLVWFGNMFLCSIGRFGMAWVLWISGVGGVYAVWPWLSIISHACRTVGCVGTVFGRFIGFQAGCSVLFVRFLLFNYDYFLFSTGDKVCAAGQVT